ncbi:uncharacterized protein LOC130621634 [Hydractinia symbiolongicarpus]|uniref:uncharacterized protein LOC130621634 n=1 Tax=Hydractinia symbiolongicarpus TaxID=13093 RepID=UPI00254FDE5B|nr:uncharacterized protein LOC130621634 [Hydractinia symbiolongicarpus]
MTYFQLCPSGLLFNATTRQCDYSDQVDCNAALNSKENAELNTDERKNLMQDGVCKVDGRTFQKKQNFTLQNCNGKCICEGPAYRCVSLCAPLGQDCPNEKYLVERQVMVSQDPTCYCTYVLCSAMGRG